MPSFNRFTFEGNMTRDPEVPGCKTPEDLAMWRANPDGEMGRKPVRFSIAVDRPKGANGETQADYFDMLAWGKLARIVESWGRKGRLVLCDGQARFQKWNTADGAVKTKVEFICSFVGFQDTPPQTDNDTPPESIYHQE